MISTIVICSSAAFYEQAVAVQTQLVKTGRKVVLLATAEKMKLAGDYDVSKYKTWFANADDYDKKAFLMHEHFDKIAAGDAILVLNYEKNGKPNYIGGNVLMEMAVAFHLQKPIYVLNPLDETSPYYEELAGCLPIVLEGDITKL